MTLERKPIAPSEKEKSDTVRDRTIKHRYYKWDRPELHDTQIPGTSKIVAFTFLGTIGAIGIAIWSFQNGDLGGGWGWTIFGGAMFNIMLIVASITAITTEIRTAALEAAIRAGEATPVKKRE